MWQCLKNAFCNTCCSALSYFFCHVPIYACVGTVYSKVADCCKNLCVNNAGGVAAPHLGDIPIAMPMRHHDGPDLLPVVGASDQHDDMV